MAFSSKKSEDSASVKRFFGLAPVRVLAVNPTAKELTAIYGRDIEKEPEYISEKDGIKTMRLDFIVKTATDFKCIDNYCKDEIITKVSFFVRNERFTNTDKTKCKMMDKYGRTCWCTVEEAKNKQAPVYKNGPARIDTSSMKPLFKGEEELTLFIRALLGCGDIDVYNSNTASWETNKKPQECEGVLEKLEKVFTGDISEIKSAIELQPNNVVKVLFGVRTTDNGQFQDVWNRSFLRSNQKSLTRISKEVNEAQANGGYSSTEFFLGELKEYAPIPTNFGTADATSNDDPFGSTDQGSETSSEMPW